MIPMSSAFADNGDCWFLLCWFTSNDKSTPEEIYVTAAQNGRERTINVMKNQISELKENSKTISDAQKSGIISGADKLIDVSNERADFLQKLIDEDNYVRNNPNEFLTQSDLVDRAMNYYKIQPDGTPCDDDRRWVEDTCRPMKRAYKEFYSWDLEWLRDHPQLD
jgi:hypothetical protein